MFDYYIDKILEFRFPVENLSFSVNNVFLKIECNIFSDTEIFHCIRHVDPQFIAYPEKMIYAGFACKNNGCKIKDINFLMTKIFWRNSFNLTQWLKIYFQVVFFCQIEIWRLRIDRFWLWYQDLPYFQFFTVLILLSWKKLPT